MSFRSPVGEDTGTFWPAGWFDATGYAALYNGGQYHTGADLNCNVPAWDSDRGAPVYSIGDGIVTFAGELAVWGNVIVIRHKSSDGRNIWSRYGHVENLTVKKADVVARGQQIATIGNAGGEFPYHLHFDIAVTDVLEYAPGHWPGSNEQAVLDNYVDPQVFLREQPEEVANVNLVKNGSFEGGTYVDDALGNRRVPDSWQYFQLPSTFGKVHVEIEKHPPHVADGSQSARVFTSYENHKAGLYQVVTVEKGAKYQLTGKVFVWISETGQVDTPSTAGAGGSAFLGVDPTGNTDPTASSVVWVSHYQMDSFITLELSFTAKADKATVFLKSETEWPVMRNDFFWDDIRMEKFADSPEDEEPGIGTGDNTAVVSLLDEAMETILEAKSLLNEEDGADTPVTPPAQSVWTHAVNATNGLKLRATPGGTILRTMPFDETVTVQSGSVDSGGYTWVPVVTAYDIGWCAKTFLRPLAGT